MWAAYRPDPKNRSPALKSRKDSPMMHPKTGPTMLPVRGRSDTPAVHKSMSSGESLIEVLCFSVSLVKGVGQVPPDVGLLQSAASFVFMFSFNF
jgi:hypothetical protein